MLVMYACCVRDRQFPFIILQRFSHRFSVTLTALPRASFPVLGTPEMQYFTPSAMRAHFFLSWLGRSAPSERERPTVLSCTRWKSTAKYTSRAAIFDCCPSQHQENIVISSSGLGRQLQVLSWEITANFIQTCCDVLIRLRVLFTGVRGLFRQVEITPLPTPIDLYHAWESRSVKDWHSITSYWLLAFDYHYKTAVYFWQFTREASLTCRTLDIWAQRKGTASIAHIFLRNGPLDRRCGSISIKKTRTGVRRACCAHLLYVS